MVVAIMLANRPATGVHLVESNARKCAFLNDVARETGILVDIHEARLESLVPERSGVDFDVVTARGLSPMPKLLAQSAPFFSSTTRGLFMKGAKASAEVAEARERFAFEAELHASRTDASAAIVEIAGLKSKDNA